MCLGARERELAINIGSGEEVSIADLARIVCQTVGFEGKITFDASRPDGTPRQLADTRHLRELGSSSARPLAKGLQQTYPS